MAPESNAHAAVVGVLDDSLSLDTGCVEQNAIHLDILETNLSNQADYSIYAVADPTKQVDVHSRARKWRLPCNEHQSALEDKFLRVRRFGQSVKKPFHGKVAIGGAAEKGTVREDPSLAIPLSPPRIQTVEQLEVAVKCVDGHSFHHLTF